MTTDERPLRQAVRALGPRPDVACEVDAYFAASGREQMSYVADAKVLPLPA